MIRVKQFRVRTGGKVYAPGMTIPHLNPAQEKRLVDRGYCEYVEHRPTKPLKEPNTISNKKPVGPIEDGPNTGYPDGSREG